jgi:tetratricopeptide (TPR) repeat protein
MDEMNIDGDDNVQINAEGDVVSAVGDGAIAAGRDVIINKIQGVEPGKHDAALKEINHLNQLLKKYQETENDDKVQKEVAKQITELHENMEGKDIDFAPWKLTELGKIACFAGYNDQAKGNFQQALRKFENEGDKRGVYASYLHLGNIEMQFGDFEKALGCFMRVQYLAMENNDPNMWINALTNIAIIERHFGNLEKAEDILLDILKAHEKAGNKYGVCIILHNLGNVQLDMGNYDKANSHFTDSLALAKEIGDYETEAAAYTSLATVNMTFFHDFETAGILLDEGIKFCKKHKMAAIGNEMLANLAILEKNKGNLEKAKSLITECLEFEKNSGNLLGEAKSLSQLGSIAFEMQDLDVAKACYLKSLKIFRETGDWKAIAQVLNNLGNLAMENKNYDRAKLDLTESLKIGEKIGSKAIQLYPLRNLGNISEKSKEFAQAEIYYRRGIIVSYETGQRRQEVALQIRLGVILGDSGRYSDAAKCFKRNAEIWKELGDSDAMNAALSDYDMMIHHSKSQ